MSQTERPAVPGFVKAVVIVACGWLGYRHLEHGTIEAEYGRRHAGSLEQAKGDGLLVRALAASPAVARVGARDVQVGPAWIAHAGNVKFESLFSDRWTLVRRPEQMLCVQLISPRAGEVRMSADALGLRPWSALKLPLPDPGRPPMFMVTASERLPDGRVREVFRTDDLAARKAFLCAGDDSTPIELKEAAP